MATMTFLGVLGGNIAAEHPTRREADEHLLSAACDHDLVLGHGVPVQHRMLVVAEVEQDEGAEGGDRSRRRER